MVRWFVLFKNDSSRLECNYIITFQLQPCRTRFNFLEAILYYSTSTVARAIIHNNNNYYQTMNVLCFGVARNS